jgi:hypothetical protein
MSTMLMLHNAILKISYEFPQVPLKGTKMLLGSSRHYNLCFNNYTQKNVTIPLDTPFVYEGL